MGLPMARNLAKAGYLSQVWNRSPEKTQLLLDQYPAINIADSLSLVAQDCSIIFICVSSDADVVEVIDALKPSLQAGQIVVDTSTISVQCSREIAGELDDQGVTFLDAPVSGGVEGARKGSLTMMIGGDGQVLDSIRPVLQAIATNIVWMGKVGNGQATKAVNQVMAAGINQAVTEALALSQALGLDSDKVIEVTGSGAAANWFLQHRGKSMMQEQFETGFKVALHHKDLSLCKALIKDLADVEKSLPVVEMTLLHYQRLIDEGYGDDDISALYRLKKRLFERG